MRYGIVHLGSKESILHIIRYIFEREYRKKNFIDLFCGGLSVTNYALLHTNFNVFANDLNIYLMSLYEAILMKNPELEIAKYEWVSREKFQDVYEHPEKYPYWFIGYVLQVWSFGCNQKDYLYAREIEEGKHALHEAIVNNDFSLIRQNKNFDGFTVPAHIADIDYRKSPTKRQAFLRVFRDFTKSKMGLQKKYLSRLRQMESLQQTEHLDAVSRISPEISRLMLFKQDWYDLYISLPERVLRESFIYCDPPYEGAKEYLFGKGFNYDFFWHWFRHCPYSVYVSSYTAPPDIKPLITEKKYQLLDNGRVSENRFRQKEKVTEKIYWNGKGDPVPTMYDELFNTEFSQQL